MYIGLELVGKFALGLTGFMLMPFVALVAAGLPRLDPWAVLDTTPKAGILLVFVVVSCY